MDEGTHVLDVTCIFGGVEIIVPGDWNIKVEVAAVLGGFEDNRKAPGKPVDPDKTLIIKGVTVFGGGEIKSY